MIEEQNVINEWKNKVKSTCKYNNEFLKTFVGELLEYISNIKDQETKNIMFDFIEKRKNFTSKTKVVIINYLKYINIQQNEYELKKKFKLYIDLGSESREKIATSLTKQLEKIYEIRNKEKQIVRQKTTVKDLEEIVEKQKKEISKLTLENVNIKKQINELQKNEKELEKKNNESVETKYINLEKFQIEKEKSFEYCKDIQKLKHEVTILKMQLNHSHNQ